jgi:hypothetical protein
MPKVCAKAVALVHEKSRPKKWKKHKILFDILIIIQEVEQCGSCETDPGKSGC